jgi:xanthine dehydrogenase accessory factor
MSDSYLFALHAGDSMPLALVLGTNEIASAVAVHLKAAGHCVILSHDSFPPVIRRAMAFHDAVSDGAEIVLRWQNAPSLP